MAIKGAEMDVYFTFDYELYLGPETGTVANCLLRPTERLLRIAQKHHVHFVFFVDVLYILKLQEFAAQYPHLKDDFDNVCDQLRLLHREGHDLELHLHPQWYYSTYNSIEGKWELDYTHYRLDDCHEEDVKKMVREGTILLKSLTGRDPICYRAGGYCFPKRQELVNILRNNGIKKDSSVLVGEKSDTIFQQYDYSGINSPDMYHFDTNITCSCVDGFFEEYPIATTSLWRYRKSIVERFLNKREGQWMKGFGDGKGVGFLYKNDNKVYRGWRSLKERTLMRASIDLGNARWITVIKESLIRHDHQLLVIIGHPKNQSEYSLNRIDYLLSTSFIRDNIKTFIE